MSLIVEAARRPVRFQTLEPNNFCYPGISTVGLDCILDCISRCVLGVGECMYEMRVSAGRELSRREGRQA